MDILAIANHKGGVGETATAHALGEALAVETGLTVLLIDLDLQAGLTGACDIADFEVGLAFWQVMYDPLLPFTVSSVNIGSL